MYALISPSETLQFPDGSSGVRVCEVTENPFPVASPLFWAPCPEDLDPSSFYWEEGAGFVEIPLPPPPPIPSWEPQAHNIQVTEV